MSLQFTTAPIATLIIMAIAFVIALLNTGVNRALISHFIGWTKYRTMQKEMAEFRSESMAAARSNDKKQMEKLKKKQSQINSMQAQMMKPQMLQMGISFVYIIVWWFVLNTTSLRHALTLGIRTWVRANHSDLLVPDCIILLRVTLTAYTWRNAY